MRVAEIIVWIVSLYAGVGAIVAAAFLLVGIDRTDPGARESYAFRPLLIPGVVMLWPFVLWRWISIERKA